MNARDRGEGSRSRWHRADSVTGRLPPAGATSIPHSSPASILLRFLRFGALGWGGPVAQIAMLRRELVDEERWLPGDRFNRLLAVYQVLPGPEAHELAVHLGMLRGGRLGGLLAGLGFMLPGLVLVLIASWLYTQVDLTRAAIGAALLGAQLGVMALILRAIERIGRHVVIGRALLAIAAGAALATLAGLSFWIVLPVAGLLQVIAARTERGWLLAVVVALVAGGLGVATLSSPAAGAPGDASAVVAGAVPSTLQLFGSGLKAGLLTFGGAYTAIPFLRDDTVGSGWLTDATFLDGLAVSGILPGPLILFGTFVGYAAGGLAGGLAVTAGFFLPAFGMTLFLGDRLESIVDRPGLHRLLEGVAAGVVGLIVATAIELAAALLERAPSVPIAIAVVAVALVMLLAWRSRLSVVVVILGSSVAGWLAFSGAA